MGLLSAALLAQLVDAGLVAADASWSENVVLGEWLAAQGADSEAAEAVLYRYFGLPYICLEKNTRLSATSLQTPDWKVYQLQSDGRCVCLRPPKAEERDAYTAVYGDTPLFLCDAQRAYSALLAAQLPVGARLEETRRYALEQLLSAEPGHVDGLIAQILAKAIDAEVTDVHFYRRSECLRIDFRIQGQFQTYADLPLLLADGIINKLKLMAEMDIAEHRLPQDGHILISSGGADYNLRVATLPLLQGEKVVLRILPEKLRRATLKELGFTAANAEALQEILRRRRGLVLITGPTNSGKTTTLYTCLKQLGAAGFLVYTIEDPVEAVLSEVQQMQVNVRSGLSFAAGLRGILRSDPDVLAVGELRDAETVDIAARAALSGQLVLATLHAENAQEAVERLRDLGLSNLLLSAVLTAVVNQRLLALPCPLCGGSGIDAERHVCPRCLGSGRAGRGGVQELWRLSEAERASIAAGESGFRLRAQARAGGFRTLYDDAAAKGLSY